MRIIGSRYSREAMALRTFAARSRLPHTWIDIEDEDDVEVLLAGMGFRPRDTPVVITPTAVLRHPTPRSSRSTSASPSNHCRATCSIWWSSEVAPPAWRPRCTELRKGSTPCRSTRCPRAGRRAPARASRTTSASRTASPATSSRRARRSRRNGSAPVQRAVRGRGLAGRERVPRRRARRRQRDPDSHA